MYNKNKYRKFNDKKILHKVKKQWITISLSLLMMIGGGAVATHVNASANTTNNQKVVNVKPQNTKSTIITNKASQLHNQLVNKANVQTLRLGSHNTKRNNNILKNQFKRSNNNKSLKRSGYLNTTKYQGHFIFNKYAPNDKRALVPKRLNLKHLNWAKGRFGKLNVTLFTHKHNGWIRLNKYNASKYKNALNKIYQNYKKVNHKVHKHNKFTNYSNQKYAKQLKTYRYLMNHGSRKMRKHNKQSYYRLKSRMKHMSTKHINKNHKSVKSSNTINTTTKVPNNTNNNQQSNPINSLIQASTPNPSIALNTGDNTNSTPQSSNSNTTINSSTQSPSVASNKSNNSNNNKQPSSSNQTNAISNQIKNQALIDINKDRMSNGESPLTLNSDMNKIANDRAQQLTSDFSHKDSDGNTYYISDASDLGVRLGNTTGENIGKEQPASYSNNTGTNIANTIDNNMMNNDASSNWGHRKNILSSNYTQVGIGASYNNGTFYLSEDFESTPVNLHQYNQFLRDGSEVIVPSKNYKSYMLGSDGESDVALSLSTSSSDGNAIATSSDGTIPVKTISSMVYKGHQLSQVSDAEGLKFWTWTSNLSGNQKDAANFYNQSHIPSDEQDTMDSDLDSLQSYLDPNGWNNKQQLNNHIISNQNNHWNNIINQMREAFINSLNKDRQKKGEQPLTEDKSLDNEAEQNIISNLGDYNNHTEDAQQQSNQDSKSSSNSVESGPSFSCFGNNSDQSDFGTLEGIDEYNLLNRPDYDNWFSNDSTSTKIGIGIGCQTSIDANPMLYKDNLIGSSVYEHPIINICFIIK